MKMNLGPCRLQDLLDKNNVSLEYLASQLAYKRERIQDFIDNTRVMPLKTAISIADTLGCSVNDLYELIPVPVPVPELT
ncbi:helix-turn-helix domain-containing protein [Paenibacillus hexagrammi]|uniref:Helix-turn-helix transcriptional regulator n=1 Tax=Paenibacillus hexagrammi TaxID=2908839 RepID=A0ABY3SPI6_9BACL|nr:helix-turn-helix transcriptional regulator [Paenibacillus sp. YPD9-1]UJF35879.1 helix-turn-helix transcriptional regulator [Paenibacillus sp. YPD9-1]